MSAYCRWCKLPCAFGLRQWIGRFYVFMSVIYSSLRNVMEIMFESVSLQGWNMLFTAVILPNPVHDRHRALETRCMWCICLRSDGCRGPKAQRAKEAKDWKAREATQRCGIGNELTWRLSWRFQWLRSVIFSKTELLGFWPPRPEGPLTATRPQRNRVFIFLKKDCKYTLGW